MPIYQLTDRNIFPNPMLAGTDGLLAVGGDLSAERLIEAYRNGIFPWYSEGQPYLWWSPDPRMVLFPSNFRRYKNLARVVHSSKFRVKIDHDFESVIVNCASIPRKGQEGETWITSEMISAYLKLHKLGYAHSVEVYQSENLVGGLYGISLGSSFFGESMFYSVTDASKVALWHLVDLAIELSFDMIDVQQDTEHMRFMGAESITRKDFITLLARSVGKKDHIGNWGEINYRTNK